MKPIFHHLNTWLGLFCDVPPLHVRKQHVSALSYFGLRDNTPEVFWPCQSFGIWGLPAKDELPQYVANQLSQKEEYTVKIGVGVASPLDPFSRQDGVRLVEKSSLAVKLSLRSIEKFPAFTRVQFLLEGQYQLTAKYLDKNSFPIIERAPLFRSNKEFSTAWPLSAAKREAQS